MTKKTINELLLDELKIIIPNKTELVNKIGNILYLGKEALYRRMRGEVPFTLEEAALLCYHFGISFDGLKEITPLKRPFLFKIANYSNPKSIDYKLVNEFVDFLDFIKDKPGTEIGTAAKLIPDAFHLNYPYISRFYLFKWMYQYDNFNTVRKFDEIPADEKLLEILKNMRELFQCIKNSYYIFDQRIFKHLVDDIKFFSEIGLINPNDLQLLKKDLYACVKDIETLASKGKNSKGNKVEIYLSNLNFEAGFSYIKSDAYKLSTIRAFTMYDISSSDVIAYENSLKWMNSLKRASNMISESGEAERMKFFNKQYETIDTL